MYVRFEGLLKLAVHVQILIIFCGIGVVRNANFDENVTVYMQSWPFDLVRKECESNFFYQFGYTSVLVSPVQQEIYSRDITTETLFNFDTPLGNIKEFKAMVKACTSHGVRVYVSVHLITAVQKRPVERLYRKMSRLDQRSTVPELSHLAPTNPAILSRTRGSRDEQKKKISNSRRETKGESSSILHAEDEKRTRWRVRDDGRSGHNKPPTGSEYERTTRGVDSISRPDNEAVAEKYKVRFDQTATESAANFLRKLISHGVTGVRIQNAGCIAPDSLRLVYRLIRKYIKERGGRRSDFRLLLGDVKSVKGYENIGYIEEVVYAENLADAVARVNFDKLVINERIWPEGWNVVSSDSALTFVHDSLVPGKKNRNKEVLENFRIANALILANPYGTPVVVSPYSGIKHRVNRLKRNENSITMEEVCKDGHCAHRIPKMRELVLFRLVTSGEKITSYGVPSENILYLNRGRKGFAVFVHSKNQARDKDLHGQISIKTDLPAGFYCNVISGYKDSTRDKCESHSVVEVDKKGLVVIDMLKSHLKEMVVIHTLSRLNYIRMNPVSLTYSFYTAPSKLEENEGKSNAEEQQTRPKPGPNSPDVHEVSDVVLKVGSVVNLINELPPEARSAIVTKKKEKIRSRKSVTRGRSATP